MNNFKIAVSITTLLFSAQSVANDALFGTSDDGLFADGTGFITDSEDNSENLADEMLVNDDGVVWSGSYQWDNQFTAEDIDALITDADIESSFSGQLKLDARPEVDYRVLLNLDYEVSQEAQHLTLREGFADFTVNENIFVRAGQQTVTWGVGYFFSPADTLSSDVLDASNPDEERIGTAAIRIHVPINTSNIYAYALPNEIDDSLTVAARGEWLVGGSELGFGATFDGNRAWNVMATYTRPTDIGDFFAEYNGSLGHSTVDISSTGDISDRSEDWIHQATVGVIRTKDWDEIASTTVSAQYYYNGEGYDHTLRTDNPMLWSQLTAQNSTDALAGQHYGAASVRVDDLFSSDVGLSASRLVDISDTSQMLSAAITWSPLDSVTFETGINQFRGDAGSSYAPMGEQEFVYLSLSLGKGSF